MGSKRGPYLIHDDTIDHAIWAEDYRYDTAEEAVHVAKKKAFQQRRDWYVSKIVTAIELNPDVDINIINTKQLENKSDETT